MAVLQVVREELGNVRTSIESLMADEHALLEGAPRKTLWSRVVALADDVTQIVCPKGVTIDNGRERVRSRCFRHGGRSKDRLTDTFCNMLKCF